jgi:hypothetical protein
MNSNDNEVLSRLQTDLTYALEKKQSDTVVVDTKGELTERNFASQNRLRIYRMWYNSVQWEMDIDGHKFDDTGYIAKPTVNFIKTIIDQRINSFKQRKVYIDVLPVSVGMSDSAVAWQYILKYLWKVNDFSGKLSLVYKDALIYGTGWFKLVWDDDEGEIDIIPIAPLDVYPDPYAKSLKDLRFIHFVFKKPAEYIENKYGVQISQDPNESVIVYESWYRGITFGDPVCITWTDQQVLDVKEVKKITGSDEFPIFTISPSKSSDQLWGNSLVALLIHPQNLHNKSLGLLIDGMLITNNGRIYTTDPDIKISNDPLEIITVAPNEQIGTLNLNTADPRWLTVSQYSGYGLMQQLSGTYAMSSMSSEAQRTASGIIAQQQAANVTMEADLVEIESDMNRFGRIWVDMIRRLYTKKDLKAILGTKFQNAESLIDKLDAKFNLFFDLSDPLPEDKLARNNLLAGLLAQNKIDLQTFARLTENIQLLDVLDEQNRQQSQQQSPLMQMMAQAGQGQDGGQGQPEGQQGGQPEGQPVGQVTTDQQVMDKAKKKEGNLEKKVAAERGVGV